MEVLRLACKSGDETFEFDPDSPDDVTKIKAKIKEYLDMGYYFYGCMKGETKMKIITKMDGFETDIFDRLILASGSKKLLTPPPIGG